MSDVYTLHRGTQPLLVSVPHVGRELPPDQQPRYVERAFQFEDADWHLDELYGFVKALGASLLVPRYSRFLIDLNRPPENAPMYPGVNNTELCPTRFFTGDPLYRTGMAPDAGEIARRVQAYWQPYHDAVQAELQRLHAAHGHAVLFDGHSIKSELPWLFDGKLPDLNLGTASGASCAPTLRAALNRVLDAQAHYTHVTDGRFKGGHITRHYGRPDKGMHAVQLEMCWSCYMAERPPYELDAQRTARLSPVLQALVLTMLRWTPHA
ncbi:MAG TPA: N-formylglutamate deformylase [Burkholderiaceae bacterium]|nr:N-formylglutamate deformylase [Burkholderiaceae bacterium]